MSDIWDFVPTESNDDPGDEQSPEEAAMHTESLDRDPMPAHDAGRAEVGLADQADAPGASPTDHLADEESEFFDSSPSDEPETDVQAVLEQQHYLLGDNEDT